MNIGRESERVEFKRSTSQLSEGLVSMVAIINKHTYGTIFFGVDDSGEVVGQQVGAMTERDISRKIYEMVKPIPNFAITHKAADGKSYIQVDFNGDEKPYCCNGLYYVRNADQDKKIEVSQLRNLFMRTEKDYAWWEDEPSGFGLEAADQELVQKAYWSGRQTKRIGFEFSDCQSFLTKLGLYRDGTLTNAGFHLFSSAGPVTLRLAVFGSTERGNILDSDIFEGNIYECIEKGIEYIRRHIDWKNVKREFDSAYVPEIPMPTIRELVVNSFSHARYFQMLSTNEIDIFRDKINIFNPGTFPIEHLPEDYATQDLEPIQRNPKIANVLFRTNMAESVATGLKDAYRAAREAGITIEFSSKSNGVSFHVHRPSPDRAEGQESAAELSGIERRIFERLKENPGLSRADLAALSVVTVKTVQRALNKLKDSGYIARDGSNKSGRWIILK
jgi:ATP-dependent DNA helicase RecG